MSSRSLSGELSHKIIISVAVLVLGGIFGIIEFSGRVVTESVKKTAESSLDTYIKDIEGMLGEVETMESFVNWQVVDHINDPDYLPTVNEKVMQYGGMLSGVTIAFVKDFYKNKGEYYALRTVKDPVSGNIVHGVRNNYVTEPWFEDAMGKGAGVWGEPCDTFDAGLITSYSTPLRNEKGEVYAVLSLDISIPGINDRLAREHFYEGSYAVILSQNGTILSHPDENIILNGIMAFAQSRQDKQFEEFAGKMVAGETGIGEVRSEQAAAIYGPVRNGWSAALISPGKAIFGTTIKFQLLILLIALGDLLVMYLVMHTLISRTLLPLTEVTYLAKNVAKGNFKAEIPQVEGTNEMFHLHEALRNMLRSINDYIKQLRTTTAANERFESELSVAQLCHEHTQDV